MLGLVHSKFGIEIYMFLALTARSRALRAFERDEARTYEPGNELTPFFQFERLLTASQVIPCAATRRGKAPRPS